MAYFETKSLDPRIDLASIISEVTELSGVIESISLVDFSDTIVVINENVTYTMPGQRWVAEERNKGKEGKKGIIMFKIWLIDPPEWAAVEGKLGVMVGSSFVGFFLGGERDDRKLEVLKLEVWKA